MCQEIDALEKNRSWQLIYLPPRKQALGCKWVPEKSTRQMGPLSVTKEGWKFLVVLNKKA